MHKLHTLYTARMDYSGEDATDITVSGGDPNWKPLAPTWDMVEGLKSGKIPKNEYVRKYVAILEKVPVATWDKFLSQETRTLVCFCKRGAFCHRNILVRHIKSILGDRIRYGGDRKSVV